ncbi:ABC transporter permease subunit [Treponema sp.]
MKALAITRKELRSAFDSPIAYTVIIFFLLFTSIWLFFVQGFFAMDTASLRSYFAVFPLVFTLVVPALTMRSWAEERKMGTIEVLFSLPLSEWDLVIGKFLASFAILLLCLALSIFVPLSVSPLGRFDLGALFGEYLGALVLGTTAIALGQFISSLAKNQISAFLTSLVLLLILSTANQITVLFDLPFALSQFINYFSLSFHFESFSKGIVDTRDLLFFILSTSFFLFLNQRVLLFRKWS